MGGLSKFIEDPIGSLADFAFGNFSANQQYEHSRDMFDSTQRFQERMSNTAYTRAVEDLKHAGLNPMLAYTQGSASSPGGSAPGQVGNVAEGYASAAAARRAQAEVELLRAQKDKVVAETEGAVAESGRLKYEFENVVPLRFKTQEFENAVKQTEALMASLEYNIGVGGDLSKYSKLVHEHFAAKYKMLPAEYRTRMAELAVKELAAKAARGAGEGYESMKRGAGWLGDKAGALTNSAVDAVRAVKHGYERFHSKAQYRRKYEFGH